MSFPQTSASILQTTQGVDSTIPQLSYTLSDHESEDDDDLPNSTYSSRMEELVAEDDDESDLLDDKSDDEEGFIYDGVDADNVSGNYRDRLRDALGMDPDEGTSPEDEVGRSLLPRGDSETARLSGLSQPVSLSC
jgi:hypothetical protein